MGDSDDTTDGLDEIVEEMDIEEIEVTDAELDTESRAEKGEQFGYEK